MHRIQRFHQGTGYRCNGKFPAGFQKVPKPLYCDRLSLTNDKGFQGLLCETRWVYSRYIDRLV